MTQEFGQGQQTPYDTGSELNSMVFVFARLMARSATVKVVQVKGVTPGTNGAPGTVDVLPLVMMIDGQGNASSHGTIYGMPYWQLQSGSFAVVLPPKVGDIGVCVVADRDISSVKANRKESPPGSFRQFDMADGIYIGGILNGAPTGFIKFTDTGLDIEDGLGNKIVTSASGVDFTAARLTCTGQIIAGFGTGDAVGLQTHQHPTAGTGSPSPPTPGT